MASKIRTHKMSKYARKVQARQHVQKKFPAINQQKIQVEKNSNRQPTFMESFLFRYGQGVRAYAPRTQDSQPTLEEAKPATVSVCQGTLPSGKKVNFTISGTQVNILV